MITDSVPEGMTLDYDSVSISGLAGSVSYPVAGTADPTNELNSGYRNELEVRTIAATKDTNGSNGWKYTINYLPSGSTATITFKATANVNGNGDESQYGYNL